jgi:hypothetical protein
MNYIEELRPLIEAGWPDGNISEQALSELNIFLINCNLSKEDRKKLVSILIKF